MEEEVRKQEGRVRPESYASGTVKIDAFMYVNVRLPAREFGGQLGEQVVGITAAARLRRRGGWAVVGGHATVFQLSVEGAAARRASWETRFIRCGSSADAVSGGTRVPRARRQRHTTDRHKVRLDFTNKLHKHLLNIRVQSFKKGLHTIKMKKTLSSPHVKANIKYINQDTGRANCTCSLSH